MSIWSDLRGQHQVLEWFHRAVARGRLSHAYLFSGPAGIGKRLFVHKLAQALFCERTSDADLEACGVCPNCKRMLAGTHPDFHRVEIAEGKREILLEQMIGDAESRGRAGMCYEMSLRPMSSDRKIAVIDDAHLMRMECGNALLKTLEEPAEKSLIVLISDQEESLLPTIRSRCQAVRFSPLPAEDLAALLIEQGLETDPAEASRIASLAEGSLTMASTLLEGPLRKVSDAVSSLFSGTKWNPLRQQTALMELVEEAGDPSSQRQFAFWVLRFLGEHFRRTGRTSMDSPVTTDFLVEAMSRVREAEIQLHESMAIWLCLQGLCDDLSRIRRRVLLTA